MLPLQPILICYERNLDRYAFHMVCVLRLCWQYVGQEHKYPPYRNARKLQSAQLKYNRLKAEATQLRRVDSAALCLQRKSPTEHVPH
jgi:hypothetical protein